MARRRTPWQERATSAALGRLGLLRNRASTSSSGRAAAFRLDRSSCVILESVEVLCAAIRITPFSKYVIGFFAIVCRHDAFGDCAPNIISGSSFRRRLCATVRYRQRHAGYLGQPLGLQSPWIWSDSKVKTTVSATCAIDPGL